MTEEQIRALNGPEFYERHERVQRQLAEMSEYFRRKAEEQRRASGEATPAG